MNAKSFSYQEAFSRNLGWLTAFEQQVLRGKRVALAGLGGVGGSHLLTLARLGIGAFTISDPDSFELANFNRQAGATVSVLGRPKAEVLRERALDINPELDIRVIEGGVTDRSIDAFLDGVDLYVDSLDFFEIEMRRKIFARCYKRGIPAITAAPIGMGTAFLLFLPGGMTFEQWFRFESVAAEERPLLFAMGLAPAGLHGSYLMDLSSVNFSVHRVPSTGLACELCAGVTAAQVAKILLGRGPIDPVPTYHQFDAYVNRWKKGRLPGGNGHFAQRLRLKIARHMFKKMEQSAPAFPPRPEREIERIFDEAKWAPSGDNAQPWTFKILNDEQAVVTLKAPEDFYEEVLEAKGILLGGGAFLESLRLVAAQYGRAMSWQVKREGKRHKIEVSLPRDSSVSKDPLYSYIPIRSAQRYPYRTTPLTEEQKKKLEESVGEFFEIQWHEGFSQKWHASLLNAQAAGIRLRVPEAFPTHRDILDWKKDFSPDRVPVKAICMDPLARRMMKILMKSWRLVDLVNKTGGGTLMPQIEMDMIPGLMCAAHFVMTFKGAPNEPDRSTALLKAGQAVQRFWLTATKEGLALQPSFAKLIYALYPNRPLAHAPFIKPALKLAERVKAYAGVQDLERIAFLGRIGTPRSRRITTRSVRRPYTELVEDQT